MQTEFIEQESAPNPQYAVIWLHGLGADGYDFANIAIQMKLPTETAIRFIFPHAPYRPITVNGGMEMRGWYDVVTLPVPPLGGADQMQEDLQGIEMSSAIVESLIAQQNEQGIPSKNIFLAGFSQGGAVVLYTALKHTQKLAGVIALSTYLPVADTLSQAIVPANQDTAIFLAHGKEDPIIPLSVAEYSQRQLQQWGFAITWRAYAMPHSLHPQEIEDIAEFLSSRLG